MRRALLIAVAACALPARGLADEPQKQILPLAAPDDTPWADTGKRVAARINRQSAGRFKLRAVTGGAQGDEVETARQCAQGKIAMWGGSAGALATAVPELSVFELPFLFDDDDQAETALNGAVQARLGKILERKGMTLYGFAEVGWRSFGGRRPMRRPADFKGLHVRSQENPIHLEMWRLLGAIPKSISVLETMSALQSNLVEAVDQSPIFLFASSWHQAITTYSVSRHIYQLGFIVFCKDSLKGLGIMERRRTLAGGAEEARVTHRAVAALTRQVMDQLRQERITVLELDARERAELRAITRPTHESFRSGTTTLGRELLGTIEAELKKVQQRGGGG